MKLRYNKFVLMEAFIGGNDSLAKLINTWIARNTPESWEIAATTSVSPTTVMVIIAYNPELKVEEPAK